MNSTKIASNQAKPSQNHNKNEGNKTKTVQNSQTFVTTIAVDDDPQPAKADSTARSSILIARHKPLPFEEKRACLVIPCCPFSAPQADIIDSPVINFPQPQEQLLGLMSPLRKPSYLIKEYSAILKSSTINS